VETIRAEKCRSCGAKVKLRRTPTDERLLFGVCACGATMLAPIVHRELPPAQYSDEQWDRIWAACDRSRERQEQRKQQEKIERLAMLKERRKSGKDQEGGTMAAKKKAVKAAKKKAVKAAKKTSGRKPLDSVAEALVGHDNANISKAAQALLHACVMAGDAKPKFVSTEAKVEAEELMIRNAEVRENHGSGRMSLGVIIRKYLRALGGNAKDLQKALGK
jgi:hypothetical protein